VKHKDPILPLLLMLILTGCNHYRHECDYSEVVCLVETRTNQNLSTYDIASYTHNLLASPLTLDSATQIALLNNPNVLAKLEDIGIAQADLIEAGLFTNPAFSLDVRYPTTAHLHTNIEYLITTSFLDLIMIPLRKKIAKTELEKTKIAVAQYMLERTYDVKRTFFELVGEEKILEKLVMVAEISNIIKEITEKQLQAGNIYKIEFEKAKATALAQQLKVAETQKRIYTLREELNLLLGLEPSYKVTFEKTLPEALETILENLENLQNFALHYRLELQSISLEQCRLYHLLGIEQPWSYTDLHGGIAGEREPDGENVLGFGLEGKLPLFNQGQAKRKRLIAQLRQQQKLYRAKYQQVLTEVKIAKETLDNTRTQIDLYERELLPSQNQLFSNSETLYNIMGLGIDRLLETKQQQLESEANYLNTLKEYWIGRVNLDQATGIEILPQQENDHYRSE
jgi:cobalt-zinc-cadmium efflux system outer membrane protein